MKTKKNILVDYPHFRLYNIWWTERQHWWRQFSINETWRKRIECVLQTSLHSHIRTFCVYHILKYLVSLRVCLLRIVRSRQSQSVKLSVEQIGQLCCFIPNIHSLYFLSAGSKTTNCFLLINRLGYRPVSSEGFNLKFNVVK